MTNADRELHYGVIVLLLGETGWQLEVGPGFIETREMKRLRTTGFVVSFRNEATPSTTLLDGPFERCSPTKVPICIG
jgi:hypothetical protein